MRGSEPTPAGAALAVAAVVAALVGCGLSLTVATLAVRLERAGFDARAIGLNTAAEGVAVLVGAPFVPCVARRVGVARLLAAALMMGAAVLLAFTLTHAYAVWLVLRFAVGLSATVMFVLGEFWITAAAPPGRAGLAIAVYVTSLAAGSAIGPLVLAAGGSATPLPFVLAALLFAVASLPLALRAGDGPPVAVSRGTTVVGTLRRAPAASLAGLLHGAVEAAAISLLPVYALRSGAPVAVGATLVSVFILGTTLLQVPVGWVADRVDRRALLLTLAVTGVVGAVMLAVLTLRSAVAFQLVLLAWGGVVGAFYPIGLNHLGTELGGPSDATAGGQAGGNAAFVMTYAFGMMAGPPLVGAGLDLDPPAGLFWAMAGLIGLYACAVGPQVFRRRRLPPRQAVLD